MKKRLLLALLAGGMVFGIAFAMAAALDVTDGTVASGEGDVHNSGCAVVGMTFLLHGQGIAYAGDPPAAYLSPETADDIQDVIGVNLEFNDDCNYGEFGVNVFAQPTDAEDEPIFVGPISPCSVTLKGGLGPDESAAGVGDNKPGCTVGWSVSIDPFVIEDIKVTIT